MSPLKPIKLYGQQTAPYSWKIVIILLELNLPYEHVFLAFPDMKKDPILSLNPNGRVPIIEDPNTEFVVWESGAIVEYLVETYDRDAGKLTYRTAEEKWEMRQWEHFQISVQDQYYGQKAYFTMFHKEKAIPSVMEYFGKEVKRTLGVIELHLARTGREYLVGDRCTFVDLMFVPFNRVLSSVVLHEGFETEWEMEMPHCYAWNQRLLGRETVMEAFRLKDEAVRALQAAKDQAVGPYQVRELPSSYYN